MADVRGPEALDRDHQRLYAAEAGLYDAHRFSFRRGRLYHALELQMILDRLAPLDGKRVLVVATGTGRIALGLSAAGARVVGADLTCAMLDAARAKQRQEDLAGPVWVNTNGRALAFPDHAFDIVTCVRFLHLLPVPDWAGFLDEMRRVLKPGGLLMLELFNPMYGGPLSPLRQLSRRARGQPGERCVWPWQLTRTLRGYHIESVSSFWLPGMGLVGDERSALFYSAGRWCGRSPLKWLAGPFLVLARPERD